MRRETRFYPRNDQSYRASAFRTSSESDAIQPFTENLTARAARSTFIAWLTIVVVICIGANFVIISLGRRQIDAPPFAWLEGAVSLAALYMTALILATQRRDDKFANHCEQLTLELAMLGDQKAAKIIEPWRS